MSTNLTVASALAGTLLATCLVSWSAQATSLPVLKGDATGIVTLVGKGGGGHGGGNGGHGGGNGGKHYSGGGNGGKHYSGGGDGGTHYAYKGGGKNYAYKDHGNNDHGNNDHGNKHYAMKDHDHDHDHGNIHNRHRVFRNGGWFWVYGDGYAGNDCYWLQRQAIVTGSPYWWDRYNACLYNYY
jgi:hypothetical protein